MQVGHKVVSEGVDGVMPAPVLLRHELGQGFLFLLQQLTLQAQPLRVLTT